MGSTLKAGRNHIPGPTLPLEVLVCFPVIADGIYFKPSWLRDILIRVNMWLLWSKHRICIGNCHCNNLNLKRLAKDFHFFSTCAVKPCCYVTFNSFFSHRHRRTEAEEDKELLEENRHSQTSVIHFESSPACKCKFQYPIFISIWTFPSYEIFGLCIGFQRIVTLYVSKFCPPCVPLRSISF